MNRKHNTVHIIFSFTSYTFRRFKAPLTDHFFKKKKTQALLCTVELFVESAQCFCNCDFAVDVILYPKHTQNTKYFPYLVFSGLFAHLASLSLLCTIPQVGIFLKGLAKINKFTPQTLKIGLILEQF